MRLLFLLCRSSLSESQKQLAASICENGSVDWERFYALAAAGRLAPLIWTNLAQCLSPARWKSGMPSPRALVLFSFAILEAQARDLAAALRFFAGSQIDAMLLKGIALTWFVCEHPWYANPGDVDLLVRPAATGRNIDWQAAAAYLRTLETSFECESHHHDLTLSGVLPIDFASVWQDASVVEFHAARVFVPCPEDMLIFACIACYRKGFFRLRHLFEIGEILRKFEPMDWPRLARKAIAYRAGRIVYAALYAAHIAVGGCMRPEDAAVLGIGRLRGSCLRFLMRAGMRVSIYAGSSWRYKAARHLLYVALSSLLPPAANLAAQLHWLAARYDFRKPVQPPVRSVLRP
jgi:hypothetical protein